MRGEQLGLGPQNLQPAYYEALLAEVGMPAEIVCDDEVVAGDPLEVYGAAGDGRADLEERNALVAQETEGDAAYLRVGGDQAPDFEV